jgi:hypothetical protein
MTLQKISSVLALCLISTILFSQKLEEGYMVTATGDTLRGYISRSQLLKKKILFKTTESNENATTYKPLDLKLFYLKVDQDYFYPAVVDVDQKPIAENNLENDPSLKFVRDTVILRLISKGKANLYSFKDQSKEHFFLQVDNGEIHELQYVKYFDSKKNSVIEGEYFKQQLKNELPGCGLDPSRIYYSESALGRFIDKYNQCMGTSIISGEVKKKIKTNFHLIIGASINLENKYSGMDLTSQLPHLLILRPSEMTYENKVNPTIGFSLTFGSNKPSNPFRGGVELFWREFSTQAVSNYTGGSFLTATTTSKFNFKTAQLNIFGQRNFGSGKVTPFIQAGFELNLLLQQNSYYSMVAANNSTVVDQSGPICTFNNAAIGYFAGAGVDYKKLRLITRFEGLQILASSGAQNSEFQAYNINILLGFRIGE